MSWNVGQLFSFTEFLLNKNQSTVLTASKFFYAFNSQQRMYMSDLLGRFQRNNNGKEGANTGLIENEVILTKLLPFTKNTTLTVTAGQATKPSDFIYNLSGRIDGKEIFFITPGQRSFIENSVIQSPSVTAGRYYGIGYQNYYDILPNTVTSMAFDYITDIIDAVYATIPDGNNRPVYDPGSSVSPIWDNVSLMEITQRTLKPYGVHFTSADWENFGQGTINTGN